MTDRPSARPQLPHHKLVAYQVALDLLRVVRAAEIRDPKLRDQAMRAAKSVALNIAEAAGRTSPADRARVFAIARDKGLILTTGIFTSDARKEATRDGVPPIELVDGEKLVAMFERAKIGLRPVQTFEIEDAFFAEFRK